MVSRERQRIDSIGHGIIEMGIDRLGKVSERGTRKKVTQSTSGRRACTGNVQMRQVWCKVKKSGQWGRFGRVGKGRGQGKDRNATPEKAESRGGREVK